MLTLAAVVLALVVVAILVALLQPSRHSRASTRYVTHVPSRQTREDAIFAKVTDITSARQAEQELTELPTVRNDGEMVTVLSGTKVRTYFRQAGQLWCKSGKTARMIEDLTALKEVLAALGEIEVKER